jgi:glyoxylase-like metal-dependent hydrolase (beta-lactamase superfamily II)
VVEVMPGVHQIDGVNPYSYAIVEDDGSLTLVDTGMSNDGKNVLDYIRAKMSRGPSDVKTIVLTHCHVPYVRGAHEIRKATGARLVIHDEDAEYLSGRKKMPLPRGAVGLLFRVSEPFLAFTPVEPDQRLKGDEKVGGGRLTVIHTPGHTPGSICLYDRQRRLILVADTIRHEGGRLQGPPREFTFDMSAASKSVQKISNVDFTTMLGGQGEALRSEDAPQRVRELAASMAGGQTGDA